MCQKVDFSSPNLDCSNVVVAENDSNERIELEITEDAANKLMRFVAGSGVKIYREVRPAVVLDHVKVNPENFDAQIFGGDFKEVSNLKEEVYDDDDGEQM